MLVHLDGQLVEHDQARVSVFDRGFLFGDGVYEGLRSFRHPVTGRRRVIGMQRHVRRFQRGLEACGIAYDARAMVALTDELLSANGLDDAFVYWQVTRGTPGLSRGPSRTRVPEGAVRATVFGYCAPVAPIDWAVAEPAQKRAGLEPDERWLRGEIKSVSLLGGVLAAIGAHARSGAEEAVLVREVGGRRLLSEGTYTNVAAVIDGECWTPPLGDVPILAGVTREIVVDAALKLGVRERAIGVEELAAADEVLLLGTTTMVTRVTRLVDQHGREVFAERHERCTVSRRLMRGLLDVILAGREDVAG